MARRSRSRHWMRVNEEIADILADARAYQESHGWWRGDLVGPNGRQVCAVGAIMKSQGWDMSRGHPEVTEIEERVLMVVMTRDPQHLHGVSREPASIPDWNDHFAKDKQEVLDVFAKAEKIARLGFDPDAP